jgi:hypothetical protein
MKLFTPGGGPGYTARGSIWGSPFCSGFVTDGTCVQMNARRGVQRRLIMVDTLTLTGVGPVWGGCERYVRVDSGGAWWLGVVAYFDPGSWSEC